MDDVSKAVAKEMYGVGRYSRNTATDSIKPEICSDAAARVHYGDRLQIFTCGLTAIITSLCLVAFLSLVPARSVYAAPAQFQHTQPANIGPDHSFSVLTIREIIFASESFPNHNGPALGSSIHCPCCARSASHFFLSLT